MQAPKQDHRVTFLADAKLVEALRAEQRRVQQQTGLRASLSATAAALMRRALEQRHT
ncbi:hypothetical protein [Cupriavidus sp. Agwp_2]|uniref:hypothetical protein n=1 Tax=Cupriavidus sp. Agwp_2 TaxID=2897324 RepID=UPI00345FFE61